jgi:hypothetical protein
MATNTTPTTSLASAVDAIEARLIQGIIPQRQDTVMETATSQVEDVSEVASELTPLTPIKPYRQNAVVPDGWEPPVSWTPPPGWTPPN